MTGYQKLQLIRHLLSVKRKQERLKKVTPNDPVIDQTIGDCDRMIELLKALKTRG